MHSPPAGLPDRIGRLQELAGDLWWTWSPAAREVFRRLDYRLWRLTAHNPIRTLHMSSEEGLARAAQDPVFLSLYDAAIAGLDQARNAGGKWWSERVAESRPGPIAYFSAEFGLHQCLPIYAGGLGVLAGDHCKEASDLGIPLIGVGFIYPKGYFHQHVSADGWQQETNERQDLGDTPVERAVTPDGRACNVEVPLGQGSVHVAVWRVRLGLVTLYLLDTDVEPNPPWLRELSAMLYVADRETRLRQEIVLGVGGVRVMRALGHDPIAWHLNEGHTAFVVFERIRELVEGGESFLSALEQVRATTAFTTHTPVAAGHDTFPFHMVDEQLASLWGSAGGRRQAFLALATHDDGSGPLFNMTALALRGAGWSNAVSRRHREVTRRMWASLWPSVPDGEGSLRAITNGIHVPTWLAPAMASLFERHLGADWKERQDDPRFWEGILSIPDEELWEVREYLRAYLLTFVRERARERWAQERASPSQVVAAGTLLDPSALTIGFARRFTEYKRPELIFHDPERLARILNAPRHPVQIIFAGKAHPADDAGKHCLQRIYRRALDQKFGGRIAFVDDYDMHVAHFLVQGCDVWLNNPREPLEACGTSGMKASINGVAHFSVGDGWWVEGYTGFNGWQIPAGDDAAEAESIYRLLEQEIVPAFYERDERGTPKRWLRIVKEAIRTVAPQFSARRMVKQYAEEMYVAVARRTTAETSP